GEIDDDMAIVVVRTSRSDLASWECAFPAEPIRVSDARRQARAVLVRWGVPAKQAELACLLVSEVVTNVVLHTTLPVRRPRRIALEPAGGVRGGAGRARGGGGRRGGSAGAGGHGGARVSRGGCAGGRRGGGWRSSPRFCASPGSAGRTRPTRGPGAVPGRPDRQPLGVAADQERQGG